LLNSAGVSLQLSKCGCNQETLHKFAFKIESYVSLSFISGNLNYYLKQRVSKMGNTQPLKHDEFVRRLNEKRETDLKEEHDQLIGLSKWWIRAAQDDNIDKYGRTDILRCKLPCKVCIITPDFNEQIMKSLKMYDYNLDKLSVTDDGKYYVEFSQK